jgi:hypothetical protein
MWAEWIGGDNTMTNIRIYNDFDEILYNHKWDVMIYGDPIEKLLWLYLKNRKSQGFISKGMVIGSHDGRNGHWIYPIQEGLSNALLIEGSEMQFLKLEENYFNNDNVELMNEIITTDGLDVDWYQGGDGYWDSVFKKNPLIFLNENDIKISRRKSISLNSLMNNEEFDWLHLDVEGLDADLILSLQKFPNIIIYESMNLDIDKIQKLNFWAQENNYQHIEYNGNDILYKKS